MWSKCGKIEKIERSKFETIFPESNIIAIAMMRNSDLIIFNLKKCPYCSNINIKKAIESADAELMKEPNSKRLIAG
jgi:hypothetical protein